MTVRKAVIPAAGLGTRFLPATKAQPKEMTPLVDKPGLQYVVEEAVRAGIEDIIVVTSRGKEAIEEHFDRAPELEAALEAAGKTTELAEVRAATELADIHYVLQEEPLGLGHAVFVAREQVGDEPFAVLLPDVVVPEPKGDGVDPLPAMLEIFAREGGTVVAAQAIEPEDVTRYGVIDHEEIRDGVARVTRLVEKPSLADAPSFLALPGRYVLKPGIFEVLERIPRGSGNELQLTDAIDAVAREEPVFAYIYEGPIWDYGNKAEFLKTTVRLALRREDLAKPFADFLRELDL